MQSINWKNTRFNGRQFIFQQAAQPIGSFIVEADYPNSALFTHLDQEIQFRAQSSSESMVLLNAQEIASLHTPFLGKTTLQLKSGKTYTLHHNLFGHQLRWLDDANQTMIQYRMPTMGGLRVGKIEIIQELHHTEALLLSISGLISVRIYSQKASMYAIAGAFVIAFLIVQLKNLL